MKTLWRLFAHQCGCTCYWTVHLQMGNALHFTLYAFYHSFFFKSRKAFVQEIMCLYHNTLINLGGQGQGTLCTFWLSFPKLLYSELAPALVSDSSTTSLPHAAHGNHSRVAGWTHSRQGKISFNEVLLCVSVCFWFNVNVTPSLRYPYETGIMTSENTKPCLGPLPQASLLHFSPPHPPPFKNTLLFYVSSSTSACIALF